MPPREVKDLYFADEATAKVMAGAAKMYQAVASVYGPGAGNALLGLPYGDPTLTRDGVTVAKRVKLADRAEDDVAQVLRQASDKTNRTAGDGTTATIVLAFNLLSEAHKRREAGENAMVLKRQLDADARSVIDFVNSKSAKASRKQLLEVAVTSSGDQNIGQMIFDTMKDVGLEGGITIREQPYPTLDVEKVNGYYFDRGFKILNMPIEYERPLIFVTHKAITANADMVPLIQLVAQSDVKKVVIIGDVQGEALQTLITNSVSDKLMFEGVAIPPPAYGDEGRLFMNDIVTYVGSRLFTETESMKEWSLADFGSAERVQLSGERAIIFKGAGESSDIAQRAYEIKANIRKETNAHVKDQLEKRYAKLVGKIAIVNVGGATQAEMEELRYRVEDAIEAVKSAMQDGVVPGGATMWVVASLTKGLDRLYVTALANTFRKLMDNAAEDAGYRFKQVSEAPFGHGFNLRQMTNDPVDLAKEGVWDATRAITQVVENATSAAGALLTTGTIIALTDKDDKPAA